MPCTLSTLIARRADRSPTTRTKLYFSPGGHTHDRHTIPPDRLHISLSDPVLVAAEARLSGASQKSGDDDDDHVPALEAVTTTLPGHLLKPGIHQTANQISHDPSDDIVEVMSMSLVDVLPPDDAHDSTSRHGPYLAPLASETFREELYIRGYLKRPARLLANDVPRKSRTTFVFTSRKVLPKILGRRRGPKIAETPRAEQVTQDAAKTPNGPRTQLSEGRLSTVASATLRTPLAHNLDSPGTDTNTSSSESFDLHEFSYITAFTTPPSSPSIVLDAEAFKNGVSLGDSEHAV